MKGTSNEQLLSMVKGDRHQVFVCECPIPIPFNIGRHAWFVCVTPGLLPERYELLYRPTDRYSERFGFLYKNALPPFGVVPEFNEWITRDPNNVVTLRGIVEGEVAAAMIKVITATPHTYPYTDHYRVIPGPNSNTYVAWVLEQFDTDITLSWRAFGKSYPVRLSRD